MQNYNLDIQFSIALLNSIPQEIVLCNKDNIIIFINDFAKEKYMDRNVKIGDSILACHKKVKSHQMIKEGVKELNKGGRKIPLYVSEKSGKSAFLVAVRDEKENLIGYYEWIE